MQIGIMHKIADGDTLHPVDRGRSSNRAMSLDPGEKMTGLGGNSDPCGQHRAADLDDGQSALVFIHKVHVRLHVEETVRSRRCSWLSGWSSDEEFIFRAKKVSSWM
jgi:hypothetical protein